MTPARCALYARVSKGEEQDPRNQLLILRQWAKDTATKVRGEYVDRTSTRDTRPQKEEVMRLVRLGVLDTVVVVSLDRWGRDMAELIVGLEEFRDRKITLVSIKEGLRLDEATGRLHAHILSAFANFERERIRERTMWGLDRARAQGKRLGRHPKDCTCEKHRGRNR